MVRSALLALALIAAPAAAQDGPARTLRVVNDTSAAVNQLFVSDGRNGGLRARLNGVLGPREGERDRLEARTLRRGGSVDIVLKGRRCRYDLRAVLADGRSFAAADHDVCARDRWAISSGSRR